MIFAPADYVIGHATAVTPTEVIENASIVVRDHKIAEITRGTTDFDIDAAHAAVIPGVIDTHTDALEKERRPRAGAEIPVEYALISLEGRLRGAGVTTVYHGTGFRHQEVRGVKRSLTRALEECAAIDKAPIVHVEHRVLHRLEIYSAEGARVLRERLDNLPPTDYPTLVSFEDHTPGQGQYANVEGLRRQLIENDGRTEEEAEQYIETVMSEARNGASTRAANEQWLASLAANNGARLLAHDADSAESVDNFVAHHGSVAEFPTTLEAARRAREHEMVIVGGGPNALRGESHSGNISVAELAANGLLDSLTSDYMPAAMLGGAWVLYRAGHVSLVEAINLVTAGPARVAGISDRGRLEPGLLADLAILDISRPWPRVLTTMKAHHA